MKLPIPTQLMLEITRSCNYRCPFCYCVWHENPALARRGLTDAEWRAVVEAALAHGVNDLLFTGGEALLREELCRALIVRARELSPSVRLSLFTNGSRLTEAWLLLLRRLRVEWATSLQGLRTYGEMTGTRRRCWRTLETVARARELSWPGMVGITVTSRNYDEAEDLFCAAAAAGASSIQIGAMMLGGRGRLRPDLALNREQWEALKQRIRAMPDQHTPYSFSDELICTCRENPPELLAQYGNPEAVSCRAGLDYGVIGPAGDYRKCLHTVENVCSWRELLL